MNNIENLEIEEGLKMILIDSLDRFNSFRIGNDINILKEKITKKVIKDVEEKDVDVLTAKTKASKDKQESSHSIQEKKPKRRRLSLLERLFITEYA